MRPRAFAIVGAIAVSLTSSADARPRFGPAAVLGAVASPLGAIFGGGRPGFGYHRRSTRAAAEKPSGDLQRADELAPLERRQAARTLPDRSGSVFWPQAAGDLADYVFFPKGKDDRFWAYGFGTILGSVLAASDADDVARTPASKDAAETDGVAAAAKGADQPAAAGRCGSSGAADRADRLIVRITQAITPSASQRDVLEQLRTALTQAFERIEAACTAATTPTERLQAIQSRIWAMHDALLTLRLPFEKFYSSLSDDQQWRLARDEGDAGETATKTGREQPCGEQAALMAEAPMRAIERAVRPTEQQRASLEALRLRSAGMAQLIMSSCPSYPLLGHMGRFSAASDRLEVMLFAAMTLSPALQDFYDSLTEKQKTGLTAAIRQLRRSAQAGSP
jgi:hypothetical protein